MNADTESPRAEGSPASACFRLAHIERLFQLLFSVLKPAAQQAVSTEKA